YARAFCAALPEFELLLGELPLSPDPVDEAVSFLALELNVLRVVGSRDRPLVMVLEDLQWGDKSTLRFIEAILDGAGPPGMLLVGTWRDDEVPTAQALETASKGWLARGLPLTVLHLANLGEPDIARMLCEMLRLPLPEASRLAIALAPHAGGNPRDTVELVNALRRDGVLSPNATGWRWNVDELERHVEGTAVMDLLRSRVSRLPRASRELLEALACLRVDVGVDEAVVATGLATRDLLARCARLSQEGVLLREPGPPPLLRLHDPIRRAAYAGMEESRRMKLHLDFARRLEAAGTFEVEAAGEYLMAAPAVTDPRECADVAALLHKAAARLVVLSDNAAAQLMLQAALTLLERAFDGGQGTPALQLACELDHHLALCRLGQFDEADEVYARIELRGPDPLAMADCACAQVGSLQNRGRTGQAIAHGLHFLRRLGFDTPENQDASEAGASLEKLNRWVANFDTAHEFDRAESTDPRAIAAANMFVRLGPTCFYARTQLAGWLMAESLSLWERAGPSPSLAVSLCMAGLVTGTVGDWRTGYLASRRLVAFCEAKTWQPASLQSRQIFAISSSHWFEPIEQGLEHAVRAREGLLKRGDLQGACFSYRISVVEVFECAATLDTYAQEVHAAIDLARRSGVSQALTTFAPSRQLLRTLRGETVGTGSFDDAEFGESKYLADNASTPVAMVGYHLHRGLAAAIFGDLPALSAHARAALSVMARQSFYTTALAHWMVVLSVAREMQEAPPVGVAASAAKLIEFERSLGWLGRRAVDAPANFRHLYLHLLAERAWAFGEIAVATGYFDDAVSAAKGSARPWHRALITERAGRFHCARSRARYGNELLAEAHELYGAWGATAKAAQLAAEIGMPLVDIAAVVGIGGADSLDTLAVLRASQALSSERNATKLRARVEEVLGSVAGATKVVLALWDDDLDDWVLPSDDGQPEVVKVDAAAHRVPLSALRYVERTDELLLLADATADNRFSRDPYFQGIDRCSMMVVPILHKGSARAMLMLENRASRGAFSVARLDAVMMIAGQLAVSLENAQLYERLERKVAEQTQQLREAQSRLLAEARRAGMAQIATNVLHN
ncbi:MAG: GAF domain-containing protein, partial [Ramlibacter sp.]|nr:GAF domain-containing protein [Ramlibacter sp.]